MPNFIKLYLVLSIAKIKITGNKFNKEANNHTYFFIFFHRTWKRTLWSLDFLFLHFLFFYCLAFPKFHVFWVSITRVWQKREGPWKIEEEKEIVRSPHLKAWILCKWVLLDKIVLLKCFFNFNIIIKNIYWGWGMIFFV
jgi:hypothetical protein